MPSRKNTRQITKRYHRSRAQLPFPHRYNRRVNAQSTINVIQRVGGFVVVPHGDNSSVSPIVKVTPQLAVVVGSAYKDMPSGHKRAITQNQVMGNLSPNVAAGKLGLESPYFPNWEWLHLVAFSIRPTHVPSLSKRSKEGIRKHRQVQQIRENLVLGSAAANTEMLTWETQIKEIARQNPRLSLQLVASADVSHEEVVVKGRTYSLSLCHRIRYHFQFRHAGRGHITAPIIVEIDGTSTTKPSSMSFEDVTVLINHAIRGMVALDELPQGIRTEKFHELKKRR